MHNSRSMYTGALVIFYRIKNNVSEFLVVTNRETKNRTFIAGAQERSDKTLEDTVRREIREEIPLLHSIPFSLVRTPVKHTFIYNKKKTERAGKRGEYTVFLGNVKDIDCAKIPETSELISCEWVSKEEVLEKLSFADLKKVFLQAIQYLPHTM